MKTMKQLILIIACSIFVISCKKNPNNTPNIPPTNLNPFSQYLLQNTATSQVTIERNDDTTREIGYSFMVSKPGTVYALGLRLIDTTRSFYVSLWDSLHHTQPLLQVAVKCNNTSGFTYQDVTYQHKEVHIDPNHTYVVSVNLTPVGGTTGTAFIFGARNNFHNPFFFTEGPVTYYIEYEKYNSKTPVFPDIPMTGRDRVLGLVDIGFQY